MLEKGRGNLYAFSSEFGLDLQSIADGLSPVMVVGDDVGLLSLLRDLADPLGDFKDLKFVVGVIIAGIPPRPLAEPFFYVPSVQAQVSHPAGDFLGRSNGVGYLGLVEVTKPYRNLPQELIGGTSIPGSMADFQNQWIFSEFISQRF